MIVNLSTQEDYDQIASWKAKALPKMRSFKLPTKGLTPPTNGTQLWKVVIPHPLEGQPLTVQVSDQICDEYARKAAPEGWVLNRPVIQGRDRHLRRVLRVIYEKA